jgi:Flp pilus assembly protein protease CpaA
MYTIAFKILLSIYLLAVAIYDFKTRRVPNLFTIPPLLFIASSYAIEGKPAPPFVLLFIHLSSLFPWAKGVALPLSFLFLPLALSISQGGEALLSLSWLVIYILWQINLIGGGDGKLAMALIASFPRMDFIFLLLTTHIIFGLLFLFLRKGVKRSLLGIKHCAVMLLLLRELPSEKELEEEGVPSAWIICLAGGIYAWFLWEGF